MGRERLKRVLVERDSYYDSVFLMLINREVKQRPGIRDAVVAMGTAMNLELLRDLGFDGEEAAAAGPADLVIAVDGESEESVAGAESAVRELLTRKRSGGAGEDAYRPVSLAGALRMVPDANLLVVSVPGAYAAREARRGLESELHVMLFSDNVSIEDEILLKRIAEKRGLLMMGPDCGTAIINGKPLCFANVVRRGPIGLVAASGTGLQEVTCSIHKMGGGVSQAIGTGGRDLKDPRVGGSTMLMGIAALSRDSATRVIGVVSKPPAPEVARKVIEALRICGRPAVVHFIGLPAKEPEGNLHYAGNLEEAAGMAVALSRNRTYEPFVFSLPEQEIDRLVRREAAGMSPRQRYLRGLFTGGTLADEALILFEGELDRVYSLAQHDPALVPADPHVSTGHTLVDLGEDVFTVGRPHPMIDPSGREERIRKEGEDPEVALILLDMVLGYGSHPDPSGAIVDAVREAKKNAECRGGTCRWSHR